MPDLRRAASPTAPPIRPPEAAALLALLAWQALAGRLGRRAYERLPRVAAAGGGPCTADPLPLSVIVPARNEAINLPGLLASLAAQRPSPAEILVVDDRSTDDTAAIAAAAGVTLVRSSGPPLGWTGKTFACHLAAGLAAQPWLLFLDADTSLAPEACGAAMAYARREGLDGLSLFPQQRCQGFWERLLLPYAYAHYFAGVRPTAALANGQFMLIGAASYARCGGHQAVKASLIDDVALALACRGAGVRLGIARGEGLAAVRMYTGLGGIWQGFSKNSFRFIAADPLGGLRTVASTVAATATLRLAWRALRLGGGGRWAAAAAAYVLGLRGLLYWQRVFRAGPLFAALYPLSSVAFMAIALNSAARVILRRGVTWRGRTYVAMLR